MLYESLQLDEIETSINLGVDNIKSDLGTDKNFWEIVTVPVVVICCKMVIQDFLSVKFELFTKIIR